MEFTTAIQLKENIRHLTGVSMEFEDVFKNLVGSINTEGGIKTNSNPNFAIIEFMRTSVAQDVAREIYEKEKNIKGVFRKLFKKHDLQKSMTTSEIKTLFAALCQGWYEYKPSQKILNQVVKMVRSAEKKANDVAEGYIQLLELALLHGKLFYY